MKKYILFLAFAVVAVFGFTAMNDSVRGENETAAQTPTVKKNFQIKAQKTAEFTAPGISRAEQKSVINESGWNLSNVNFRTAELKNYQGNIWRANYNSVFDNPGNDPAEETNCRRLNYLLLNPNRQPCGSANYSIVGYDLPKLRIFNGFNLENKARARI